MKAYNWSEWDHLLGTMTDANLAALIGCGSSTVSLRRNGKAVPVYAKPRPANVLIKCACGCGSTFWKYDQRGREREFLPSHWSKIQPTTLQIVYCLNCGTPLERPRWHRHLSPKPFCDVVCHGKWATEKGIRRGEHNGMWAGGIGTFYPLEFTEELKEQVRTRDGHQCQMCGVLGDELGRALDVHHINYDRNDCQPRNLISLCHSCHAKTSAPANRADWQEALRDKEYQDDVYHPVHG